MTKLKTNIKISKKEFDSLFEMYLTDKDLNDKLLTQLDVDDITEDVNNENDNLFNAVYDGRIPYKLKLTLPKKYITNDVISKNHDDNGNVTIDMYVDMHYTYYNPKNKQSYITWDPIYDDYIRYKINLNKIDLFYVNSINKEYPIENVIKALLSITDIMNQTDEYEKQILKILDVEIQKDLGMLYEKNIE